MAGEQKGRGAEAPASAREEMPAMGSGGVS